MLICLYCSSEYTPKEPDIVCCNECLKEEDKDGLG